MAKRIVSLTSLTPTATADATNLANNTYFTYILGGSTTQTIRIVEIYEGGLAGTSAPTIMLSSFDSTIAGTPAAGNVIDQAADAGGTALATVVIVGSAATTLPQRATSHHLHNLSLNAFGGIVRLNWPQDQQVTLVGNAVNLGEMSISCFTGGTPGLIGFHCIYEPS